MFLRKWFCFLSLFVVSAVIFAEPEKVNVQAGLATGIEVSKGFVRVPIPGQKNTAAFFSITNNGKKAKQLVAIQANITPRAEIHSHTMSDGLMRMRQVKSVALAAGTTTDFAPGGFHIMLFNVQRTLRTGGSVSLTLKFADNTQLPITVPIKSVYDHAHH